MSMLRDPIGQIVAMPAAVLLSSSGPRRVVVPGPAVIAWWGVDVPILSLVLGIVGVGCGMALAPAPAVPLSWRRWIALLVSLVGLELGIVMATGQQPLVAMGWGIGLGFSGLGIAQLLGAQALGGIKTISDAFFSAIAARIGGSKKDNDNAPG